MRRSSLLLLLSLWSCETPRLRAAVGELVVSPRALDFEQAYVSFPVRRGLVLQNRARVERTLRLATGSPFSVPERVVLAGGAELEVEVVLEPNSAGAVTGTVSIGDETETFVVELTGVVSQTPNCEAGPCEVSAFDPALGRCVASQASDGASCAGACVTGTCAAGRCVGAAVSCVDADPCTVDACQSIGGCQHRPVECASPVNRCKVARCDASLGCVESDVRDGTACGPSDCVTAQVCVLGECKPRPAPDGAACGPTSICQVAGTCVQSVCVQPPPTPLTEAWRYEFPGMQWNYRGVTDAAHNLYWLECEAGGCSATSYTAGGAPRFRTTITGQATEALHHLIIGDQLIYAANGTLGAIATTTGAALWSMQVPLNPPGAPDLADRLRITALAAGPASIIVSVERSEGQTPRSSLVLGLDAASRAIGFARFVNGTGSAPVLDEAGNLYLLITPGSLISLSPSGVERWRLMTPGSAPIATFNGELLLEGGEVRSTVDGAVRVVSSAAELISNPLMGPPARLWLRWVQTGQRLEAFATSPGTAQASWERLVAQLHGALLTSETIATDTGGLLVAVGDSRHPTFLSSIGPQGEERFACAVLAGQGTGRVPIAPALLEGRWAGLEDRYLNTPLLHVYDVPGVRPATRGWVTATGSPAGDRRPLP